MKKWNFEKQIYEPYRIPNNWNTPIYTSDMGEAINCAQCGKLITYGEAYTSRQIHNGLGLGYPVCEDCHNDEWKKDYESRKKK